MGHIQARRALGMLLEDHEPGQDETGNRHIQVIKFLDINRLGNSFGIVISVHFQCYNNGMLKEVYGFQGAIIRIKSDMTKKYGKKPQKN